MAIAAYTERDEGEQPLDHLRRNIREYLFARGGNPPELVSRWLRENTALTLAGGFMETWAAMANDEHEFVELDADDDEADVEAFELVDDHQDGDIADERGALRSMKRAARKDTRRNQRRAIRAAGKQLYRRADKRKHAEKYGYTLADVVAVIEEMQANGK